MWDTPLVQRFLSGGSKLLRSDMCQHGAPYQKRTGIITDLPAHLVSNICTHRGVCSRTGRPHQHLQGTDDYGRFKTSLAEAYPRQFCERLVHAFETVTHERDAQVFATLVHL